MRHPLFKILGIGALAFVAIITLIFVVKALIGLAILAIAFKLISRGWRGGYGQRSFSYNGGRGAQGISGRDMQFGYSRPAGITPIESRGFGRADAETIVPVF